MAIYNYINFNVDVWTHSCGKFYCLDNFKHRDSSFHCSVCEMHGFPTGRQGICHLVEQLSIQLCQYNAKDIIFMLFTVTQKKMVAGLPGGLVISMSGELITGVLQND